MMPVLILIQKRGSDLQDYVASLMWEVSMKDEEDLIQRNGASRSGMVYVGNSGRTKRRKKERFSNLGKGIKTVLIERGAGYGSRHLIMQQQKMNSVDCENPLPAASRFE